MTTLTDTAALVARLRELAGPPEQSLNPELIPDDVDADRYLALRAEEFRIVADRATRSEGGVLGLIVGHLQVTSAMAPPQGSLHHLAAIYAEALSHVADALPQILSALESLSAPAPAADGEVEAVARAICAEKCAYMGEPACWTFKEESFPPSTCDEPGCMSEARAAIAALPRRDGMREALEKIDGEAPVHEPPGDAPNVGPPPGWREDMAEYVYEIVREAFEEGKARGRWEAAQPARAALKGES